MASVRAGNFSPRHGSRWTGPTSFDPSTKLRGRAGSEVAARLTQNQRYRFWPAAGERTNSDSCQQFPDYVIPMNIKSVVMRSACFAPDACLVTVFPEYVQCGR